jgi:uncharacterized protein (DUF488 family)
MATAEFAEGIDELLEVARAHRAAVMCAETLWWRCHRRLIADHLVLVERMAVEHLFHDGDLVRHDAIVEARVQGGHLIYPSEDRARITPPPLRRVDWP